MQQAVFHEELMAQHPPAVIGSRPSGSENARLKTKRTNN
jgi:hypothetical protein